jgi:hypothetical protein
MVNMHRYVVNVMCSPGDELMLGSELAICAGCAAKPKGADASPHRRSVRRASCETHEKERLVHEGSDVDPWLHPLGRGFHVPT